MNLIEAQQLTKDIALLRRRFIGLSILYKAYERKLGKHYLNHTSNSL